MISKINPYPGLRPFTEKESIFFKGRDLHIRQIIKQLQEKKIIIITGASGDGKSSLVYAGVIPNARAGFFRAEYNNWLICDFRPERNPLQNLSKTLSENLNFPKEEIENELQYGFSSLVKLYKKSSFYIDKNSDEWINASEGERRKLKAKGANLFILADQFEEFFTNPENYAGGIPSDPAYLTVNLLLESAGLAINEELPIYVVFTMRSDFISQSVSFKGLPEYIGYSQFFVPRLQRAELQQVIEEPAKLAGGSISKRLTETLINELRDGFDQLPIIQYSLSQLWKVAGSGKEEMDLVHLVKLAGLPTKYLSSEDKNKFNNWLVEQEAFKQKYYQNTGLSNVLNTHANVLYETALFYYQEIVEWADSNISEEDTKMVIKTAFQSLTKIDMGRAVRNRVTLREITDIVNREDINYETVCGILNIFRLPGNNFIRPYIEQEDIETQYLSSETILDITHEALIRNWEVLSYWETEERENFNDFQEFSVQLQRWRQNDKTKEFLLPLGPLVHFEKWYKKNRPNKYWIAKYDDTLSSKDEKLENAELFVENISEYLRESRAAIVAAENQKKRRRKIFAILSIVVILVLGGFTYWALKERKFAFQQKQMADEQKVLAEKQKELAEIEKNKAIKATRIAERERIKAEKSRQEALWAKAQSDSARKYAIFLKVLAEEQSELAKQEAENAKKEKKRADNERKIAEDARMLAEQATDSATTLNFLTLARTLALKAQVPYEDPQVNLLLAYQAYKYNNQYGGFERNPEIYNAFRYALAANGKSNALEITKELLISFKVDGNIIILHTVNNELIKYDFIARKIIEKRALFKTKIPVNTSYFISKDYLVVGFEDKKQYLVQLESGRSYELKGHASLIRSADKNPVTDEFVTAGRDRTVRIWKIQNKNQTPLKTYNLDSRVNAIRFTADGKKLIAAENNGSITILDLQSGEKSILEHKENFRALSIGQNNTRDMMAVGFDNGSLVMFYPKNKFNKENYLLSRAGIKSIDFANKNSLLSISKENKKVDINEVDAININTIKIMDHDVRVSFLTFSQNDRLFGLCQDNLIRFWEKDNKTYANIVKSMISRNFTKEEWEMHIGKKIEYRKTIN